MANNATFITIFMIRLLYNEFYKTKCQKSQKKKKFKVVTNFIKYSLQIDIKIKIDGF